MYRQSIKKHSNPIGTITKETEKYCNEYENEIETETQYDRGREREREFHSEKESVSTGSGNVWNMKRI